MINYSRHSSPARSHHSEDIDDKVSQIRATYRTDKGKLMKEGAIKIIQLLAAGRIKVDINNEFWSCDLGDNLWSTNSVRWGRLLRDLEQKIEHWADKREELKKYFETVRDCVDRSFHKKLDHTLKPGMLPFQNGLLLDLSRATTPSVRTLTPDDFVSFTGVIKRDLPEVDQLLMLWQNDQMLYELESYLRKNFCDEPSYRQVMQRIAFCVLHGKPNDAKFWVELTGPADGGKTMVLTAVSLCVPGLVLKVNISIFTTAESKKSSGPNEALVELQGVRLAYAEEPSEGQKLDGGWLKDLCGGVELSTSKKNEHQIRFNTTFHPWLISNKEEPMAIAGAEGTHSKRVGWRMLNRFVNEGDPSIDNVTVYAAERGVRDLIGDDYWVSMLRLFHTLYHDVMQGGSTPRFDTTETEFALTFPPPDVVRGMDYYIGLFEVYTPTPGEGPIGMEAIYEQLNGSHGLKMEKNDFYVGSFKPLMIQKIKTYRAANGIPEKQKGGPRFERGSTGPKKFYGIRLAADYDSD